MNDDPKPIFIFSLPRSGSTLLQRLLATHGEIATVSEPWILLPLVYALHRSKGVYAEYDHGTATQAITEFCDTMPEGQKDYDKAVRAFALSLYGKASKKGIRYFVDKTPRYHLIVEEIISIFPEAKFIFLWRNPLSIAASLIDTLAEGKWNLYRYKVDLFTGLENLTHARKQYVETSYALRYEDLVENPEQELEQLLGYLDLPFEPSLLSKLDAVKPIGRMGDRWGMARYNQVSEEPVNKWKATLANPVRKSWSRRYVRWIGEERLSLMGYDSNELHSELDNMSTSLRLSGADIVRGGYGVAYELLETDIFKRKLRALSEWRHVHAHS